MALYSLVLIRDGKLSGDCKHWCYDDLDALDMAYKFCADQTVEVWEADRLVAQVKENDSPLVATAFSDESMFAQRKLFGDRKGFVWPFSAPSRRSAC